MCAILMEQEKELTIVQVANRLGISVDTVKRRISAGRLKARKEGRELRIKESDLDEYIRSTFDDVERRDTSKRDTDKFPIVFIPPPLGEELRG